MKIGIPMYVDTKSAADQFPLRKTGKPATNVMMVEPTRPYHAVYGCHGDFHGKESRLTP